MRSGSIRSGRGPGPRLRTNAPGLGAAVQLAPHRIPGPHGAPSDPCEVSGGNKDEHDADLFHAPHPGVRGRPSARRTESWWVEPEMRHGRIRAGGLARNASQEMSKYTVWRIFRGTWTPNAPDNAFPRGPEAAHRQRRSVLPSVVTVERRGSPRSMTRAGQCCGIVCSRPGSCSAWVSTLPIRSCQRRGS